MNLIKKEHREALDECAYIHGYDLDVDELVYSEILERTGASSATISRVARALTDSDGGYERIFARMKGEK